MTSSVSFLLWFCLALPALPIPLHPLALPFPAQTNNGFIWLQPSFLHFTAALFYVTVIPALIWLVSIPTPGLLHKCVCTHMWECVGGGQSFCRNLLHSEVQLSLLGKSFSSFTGWGGDSSPSPSWACNSLFWIQIIITTIHQVLLCTARHFTPIVSFNLLTLKKTKSQLFHQQNVFFFLK